MPWSWIPKNHGPGSGDGEIAKALDLTVVPNLASFLE